MLWGKNSVSLKEGPWLALTPLSPWHRSCPQGWASDSLPPEGGGPPPGADMSPLLDALLAHVAPPCSKRMEGGWVGGQSCW